MTHPDFISVNHGSVLLLMPCSDAARAWTDEHLPENAQWFGRSVVIEPRYFADIADGILADGLTLNVQ
jgi:hypothetical protein